MQIEVMEGQSKKVLPVAECGVEVEDDVLLLGRDVPPLEVGPEVVDPPKPAALAAAQQAGILGHRPPRAFPVLPYVPRQLLVLLLRPPPPPQPHLLAARRPPHAFPPRAAVSRVELGEMVEPACPDARLGSRIYAACSAE